jgi:hypothetical protein
MNGGVPFDCLKKGVIARLLFVKLLFFSFIVNKHFMGDAIT